MPLFYGEGEKAFVQLQEEIIKSSNDHSNFLWGLSSRRLGASCLASSPREFKDSGKVVQFSKNHSTRLYTMTNGGLQVQLPVMQAENDSNISVALPDCHLEGDFSSCFAIEFANSTTST
jgi:hypothetical protein